MGPHWFRWEPPDTGYVVYTGDVDGPTMKELSQKARTFTIGKPRVFLIVDMTYAGRIATEARKISADGSAGLALRGIAVIGASWAVRVIATLVTRAVDLLHQNTDNPTKFFANESEARAWIDGRRRMLDGG